MSLRYCLVLSALLIAGRAEGQSITCPRVDFTTEVESRAITLRWQDPPESLRTTTTLSLRKVRDFLCGADSICMAEDSLSWRGTSLPTIGGRYTGGCDVVYTFRSFNTRENFTTVDTARVSAGWSGTSLPASGGTFQSCVDSIEFRFLVTAGGNVGPGGSGATIAWTDSTGRAGTVTVPASYDAGALLDVFAGLQVGFSAGSLIAGETFTIRTRVPDPLLIQWVHPVPDSDDVSGNLDICRPDTAVLIENGITISFSPGDVPEFTSSGDSVGVFRVSAETFDGFRVYRSDIRGLDNFALLREFNMCRAADNAFFEGNERVYRDTDVHNGFPYRYAVACYDTLGQLESPFSPTVALYPRTEPSTNIADIRVVPNPFRRRAAWEEGGESKVQFVNVPVNTTLRIYTASGSLVREIGPDEIDHGCSTATLPGCVNWDLRNGQGEQIVSGVYIFHAEAPGTDPFVGKFMVAR